MRIEVYDESTVEKIFFGDSENKFFFHKTMENKLIERPISIIRPKYIKWNYNGTDLKIESEKRMKNFNFNKDYFFILYDESDKNFTYPHNTVIYNFEKKIHHVVKVPCFKSEKLKNLKNSVSITGFRRLDIKNKNSSYFIFLDGIEHIIVLLTYHSNESAREGKLGELQALNVETGEFHPTWYKYYDRM